MGHAATVRCHRLVGAVLSNLFLFMLILGMAGTTDLSKFREKLGNYRGIGTGLGCQFILLPFLGFSSVKAFNIPQNYGVMLLIVTSSPGGGFSGWQAQPGAPARARSRKRLRGRAARPRLL